jgi:hypothetical protein
MTIFDVVEEGRVDGEDLVSTMTTTTTTTTTTGMVNTKTNTRNG